MCKIGFDTIRKKKYEQYLKKKMKLFFKDIRSIFIYHLKRNR